MRARPPCLLLPCVVLAVGPAQAAEKSPAPPAVTVVSPVVRVVTDHGEFTGRTAASATVEVRARVSGYLEKVLFQDGAEVKEGEALFQIDRRPYQAELERAEAALALSTARLERAQAEHNRAAVLARTGALGREEIDKIAAERIEAQAAVRLARAGCDLPRLNLDFTLVRAPVNGRIGRRLLDPGNLVNADQTALVTLITLDPTYVYFNLDERTVLRLRRAARDGKLGRADGSGLPVAMALADENGFPRRGKLDFTENRVDPETGTLQARAVFPNADKVLVPGLSVRVRLPLGEPYQALLVPEGALGTDRGQKFVFVVTDKNVLEHRGVQLGSRHDGLWAVAEGLRAGDRVVLGGLAGLRPGMVVDPRRAEVPAGGGGVKAPAD